MAQTNQNGARAKILRALIINGMLTTEELAQQTGLTAGQARDNANAAVVSRLVVKGKDCVTGLLGYQITPLGRLWMTAEWRHGKTAAAYHALLEAVGGSGSQGLRESIEAAFAAGFEVDAPPGCYWQGE